MIRIRPGRSWRLNPAYLGDLRRADEFTGSEILDVLGIEVDGVDIAAGVGEAPVLTAVDDLAQALLRLGAGEPAAQATIGRGPTELVMEARGQDLLLTLVSMAPPARVLAGGLLVDAARMRTAVLQAARVTMIDLLSISMDLTEAPLVRRLTEARLGLTSRRSKAARKWPARAAQGVALGAAGRGPRLMLQLPPETVARLRSSRGVPAAPLAAHLGPGTLTLARKGAPGLEAQGPIFLLLRNLLESATALIEAWEAGERAFTLHLGEHELRCDLTSDQLRAAGWRTPGELSPLRLSAQVAELAQAYAELSRDDYAAGLRERALLLRRHCRDLESGDLRRAPDTVAAPPSPSPPQRAAPLARGRMRRLVYREAFRIDAPGALRALFVPQGPLLVEQRAGVVARDAASGEQLWTAEAMPGVALRGMQVFVAEPGDALACLDALTGEPRWKRRLRGAAHPARLWPIDGGVLRALPGEGLALVGDSGGLVFRARLPGGAPLDVAQVEGVLVAALASGSLAGLDKSDGRVLWKRRCKPRSVLPCGARALAVCKDGLWCVDASGSVLWERALDATALVVQHDFGHALGEGALRSFALADGVFSPLPLPLPLAWATALAASDDDLVATGPGGAAARIERGAVRWSVAATGSAPGTAALIQRGVALVQSQQTQLFDLSEGLPLATLPAGEPALAPDLSVALLRDGSLSLHRLATHLSVL